MVLCLISGSIENLGELKKYDAVEGFDSTVKLKWSEGVEYFYNQLEEKIRRRSLQKLLLLFLVLNLLRETLLF